MQLAATADFQPGYAIAADGMAFVRNAVPPTDVAALKDAIEYCRVHPGPNFRTLSKEGQPVVQSDLFRWHDVPAIRKAAFEGMLPRLACEAFGTDRVIVLEDQFFYSEQGSGTPSPWHQDEPYHPLDPWFLTVWVPLDPYPAAIGIKAVPGSHLKDIYAPVEFSAGKATLETGAFTLDPVPDIDAQPDVFPVSVPDADPGDAVLLDSRTLHGAGGRCDATFRRISIRYAHPDTVYKARPWPVAAFWAAHEVEGKYGQRIESQAFPMVIPT